MNKQELQSLLERLEQAGGPDRDLDASIYNVLPPTGNAPYLPEYTSSIGAAVDLVERVLPMAFVTLDRFSVSDEGENEWRSWVKVLNESDLASDRITVRQRVGFGKSPRPSIAILFALLKSLIAQETGTPYTVGDPEGRKGEE